MKNLNCTFIFLSFIFQLSGQNMEVEGDSYISGNLGIGISTPSSKLQVGDLLGSPGNVYITVGSAGGNTSISGLKLRHFSDDFGFTIESNDNSGVQGLDIRRHAGSSVGISDMFIDLTGKIGIGTTSPTQKLDVNGAVNVAGVISGVSDPVNAQDAATKNYVDQMSELLLDAGINGIVQDIDGNVYKTIKIGTQVWMVDNLKTTHYNDGTAIPEVSDATAWSNLTTPGYTWYDNDSTMHAELHGALYNYYAVADTNSLNVCPVGWDVPTDAEWTILTDFLEDSGFGYGGSGADISKSMASTFGWTSSGTAGRVGNDQGTNNSSGFSGLPGGRRDSDGTFNFVGSLGYWWSSTEYLTSSAWHRYLFYNNDDVYRNFGPKGFGFSVRCLRD